MSNVLRGEVWAVDFDAQTHGQEPGGRERPVLVLQSDALNNGGHLTTIVVPGTREAEQLSPDYFPLRVRIQKRDGLEHDTDLLVDQVRAISNKRFRLRYCTVDADHLKRVEEALRWITGR